MARPKLSDITSWITEAALAHPQALAQHLSERLGVGRASARRLLRTLEQHQWLQREGTPRRPRHVPGLLRQVVRSYPLANLQEDLPWARDFAPCFALPPTVARMAQHVFTELLNNAIDHSDGTRVVVSMRQTPSQIQLLVSDDGRGLFQVIGENFDIGDPMLAMLELAKGKLSSQPERHTGRGLFFSARLADVMDLHANAAAFQQRQWQADQWLPVRSACRAGTSVYVAICLDTERSLDEVMRRHSLDGLGYGFDRTVVPLKLLAGAPAVLESRAQARRVASRLAQFRCIDVDFHGVTDVGHAFADELFRVFGGGHPELRLVPVNMAPGVAALVDSVRETPALAA
jgi:anti-sigma regulatory factor (Ser/Thr protein kinase)